MFIIAVFIIGKTKQSWKVFKCSAVVRGLVKLQYNSRGESLLSYSIE